MHWFLSLLASANSFVFAFSLFSILACGPFFLQTKEKDVILNEVVGLDEDSTRNVLNPDPPPQQLSIIPTSLHVAHSDESDVDTDESDIVPLGNAKQKAGLGRKQPESGNSEG